MGRTHDALLLAERAYTRAGEVPTSQTLDEWKEDLAALQVSIHALEDRIELELPTLGDELRQAIRKAEQTAAEQAVVRDTATEDRLGRQLEQVRHELGRLNRHLYRVIGLACAALLLVLVRC